MKLKCAWCNTENEAERKICRECGLPVAKKLSLLDDMGSSGAESRPRSGTRWRALPVAPGLLPLVSRRPVHAHHFSVFQKQGRRALNRAPGPAILCGTYENHSC